jgi:hypothetical protein
LEILLTISAMALKAAWPTSKTLLPTDGGLTTWSRFNEIASAKIYEKHTTWSRFNEIASAKI